MNEPLRFCYSPLSSARTAHRTGNVTLLTLRCGLRNAARWPSCAIRRICIGLHTALAVQIIFKLEHNEIEPNRQQAAGAAAHRAAPVENAAPSGSFQSTCCHRAVHRASHPRPRSRACTPCKPTRARNRNRSCVCIFERPSISIVLRGV